MDDLKENVLLGTGIVLLVIAAITLLTNGVLLYTLYCNPLRCFRNTTAVLIACLAVSDFLTGGITALDVGVSSLVNSQGIKSFRIKGVLHEKLLSQFTVRSGILVVVAFSTERFLAVSFPFFYRHFLSPKKALAVCIVCAVGGLISSLMELTLDAQTFGNMSFYGFFVTPLCLIVLLYLSVFIAVKAKLRRSSNRLQPAMTSGVNISEQVRIKREVRVGTTAFYIVLGFILSYTFWFTVVLIGTHCPSCSKESWYYACYRASIPFLYLNSAFNPLLYAWRIPKYRQSVMVVFKRGENRVGTQSTLETISLSVKNGTVIRTRRNRDTPV